MEKLIDNITIGNVGDLRAFISVLPDDMPARDAFGDDLHLAISIDQETGDKHLEVES